MLSHQSRSPNKTVPPKPETAPRSVKNPQNPSKAGSLWRQLTMAQAQDPREAGADRVADRLMSGAGPVSIRSTAGRQVGLRGDPPPGLGAGKPLEMSLQNLFEPRLGRSLDNVRIHTDKDAGEAASGMGAQAFSFGNHMVFGHDQYHPDSMDGQHLVAHELAHIFSPKAAGDPAVFRKVTAADVETEFNSWADANQQTKDKNHKDFPWAAWDFIRPQIQDSSTFKAIPKPTDKAALQKWEDNFAKADIVAGWIETLAGQTQSDTVKKEAQSKIYFIAETMAQAGLITKAMTHATHTDNEQKGFIYGEVLKNPSAATAAELVTIFELQVTVNGSADKVPMLDTLCNDDGNALQKLDAARTKALFEAAIKAYGSHDKVVEAIASVLIFNTAVRTAIADDMMGGKLGTSDLLFKVLSHPYFKDPEYEGAMLLNTPNNDVDKDTEKHWKDDMPFAYKYKQKYYVTYLIGLAKKHGTDIKAPTDDKITTLKSWLDTNTETIGQALAKEYPSNDAAIFAVYNNIADIFFYHTDKDVTPDNAGKLAKLGTAGKPDKMRIEADCDVFATYAMRLVASAGYEAIGYLGLYPQGTYVGRDAHAAALIRKGGTYFIINNKGIYASGITEATANEKKEEAIAQMKETAIDQTYGDPKPTQWQIYYADAGSKGELPADFLSKPQTYRKAGLE